jgi:hypothetical protein
MKTILNWFETISLAGTTGIVAGLSGLLTLACTRMRAWRVKVALAVIAPFIVSYCVYWLPAWMGKDASEYSAWAFIIIFPWGLAGVAASLAVVGLSYVFAHRSEIG